MPITKRKPSINQLFGCSLYANHIYPSFSVESFEMASEFTLDWPLTLGTVFSTYSTTGFTTCRITCRFSTWSTGTLDVSGGHFRWDFFMILDNFWWISGFCWSTQKKSSKLLPQHVSLDDLACESFHGTGGPCCPLMAWFGSENWVYTSTLKCHQINDNDVSINPWVFSGQPIFRPTLFSTSGNQVTARSSFSTTGVDSIRSTTSIWYLGQRPGYVRHACYHGPKMTGNWGIWIMILIPIYPPRFCQSNLVTIYSIHSLISLPFYTKAQSRTNTLHVSYFPTVFPV